MARRKKEGDPGHLKKPTIESIVAPSSSSSHSCLPFSVQEMFGMSKNNHHHQQKTNNNSSSSNEGLLAASRSQGSRNTATVAVTTDGGTNIGASGRGKTTVGSPHLKLKASRKFSEHFNSKLRKFSALGPSKRFIPSISEG